MRATSATVMLIFSKVLFRKLLDHSYVKVSSQQLRGTLTTAFWRTPYGWRFYGHGARYVVIISSRKKKKSTPHFKEHCTKKDDISRVVIRFFFSQINPVFKSKSVFINILDSFCHCLFTFLPFDFYLYSTDFEVHPLRLFLKK